MTDPEPPPEPPDADDPTLSWQPVLVSTSTPADLERAIAEWTQWSLRETRAMLEGDERIPGTMREQIMAQLTPIIWERTREALTSGYLRIHPPH